MTTSNPETYEFSDAVLQNALESLWQFLDQRGGTIKGFEKSLEIRCSLHYLTNPSEAAGEVRMLRTIGDWANSAWELEDRGTMFEAVDGIVTSNRVQGDNQKQREQLMRLCFAIMGICGTKAEVRISRK